MKAIVTDSSNFKDFRERYAYYVDKTKEVVEFFDLNNKIILMPRPDALVKLYFYQPSTISFQIKKKIQLYLKIPLFTIPTFSKNTLESIL